MSQTPTSPDALWPQVKKPPVSQAFADHNSMQTHLQKVRYRDVLVFDLPVPVALANDIAERRAFHTTCQLSRIRAYAKAPGVGNLTLRFTLLPAATLIGSLTLTSGSTAVFSAAAALLVATDADLVQVDVTGVAGTWLGVTAEIEGEVI